MEERKEGLFIRQGVKVKTRVLPLIAIDRRHFGIKTEIKKPLTDKLTANRSRGTS